MVDSTPSFEDALRMTQLGVGASIPLALFSSAHPDLEAQFAELDFLELATVFGGLLCAPELHGATIGLETLVHLAVLHGRGRVAPGTQLVVSAFEAVAAGPCSMLEDPPENVFVESVATSRGNFRILTGIWETPGFWLQRVIEVVESMPDGPGYDELRESTFALLTLSDRICERAGLARHDLGAVDPPRGLPEDLIADLTSLRRLVEFDEADLAELGVSPQALIPFLFTPDDRSRLPAQELGHSSLERWPVLRITGSMRLVLPTAVSVAIRRLVVERVDSGRIREAFVASLGREYVRLVADMPFLPADDPHFRFFRTENGAFAATVQQVDEGRVLAVVLTLDTLEDFQATGLAAPAVRSEAWSADVNDLITTACAAVDETTGFRSGIILVVGCGVGRAGAGGLDGPPPGWRIAPISAADLATLSTTPGVDALSFWRILDAYDRVQDLGVELPNVNGLLNLFAWSRQLDGHLVPHGALPDDFLQPGQASLLMMDQHALRDVRHEAATHADRSMAQDVEGRWRRMVRLGEGHFEEDRRKPIYFCLERELGERGGMLAYMTPDRVWWSKLNTPPQAPGHYAAQRAILTLTWLQRSVPVLDGEFRELPHGPLLWTSTFTGNVGELEDDGRTLSYADVRSDIRVATAADGRRFEVVVGPEFEQGLIHPENISERAFVDAVVEAVAQLAGRPLDATARAPITDRIVLSPLARQTHAFRNATFRDRVAPPRSKPPVTISRMDDALSRLGLGWRVRDVADGPKVEGKADAGAFANRLVTWIEGALCAELHRFNRAELIEACLRNYEAAMIEQQQWRRTAGAMLALLDDQEAARAEIARREFKRNAALQASRLLIEFAICECPIEGGETPGTLDLARLMTFPAHLMHVGGWSDAIRWDVMEPFFRITPLGDVHATWRFQDEVLDRFGRRSTDVRVDDAVATYPRQLDEPTVLAEAEPTLEPAFAAAWREQMGASVDEYRRFLDALENHAIARGEPILRLRRSELFTLDWREFPVTAAAVGAVVDTLTLAPRAAWREVPEGFSARDLQPWRFRRALSVLRRPLVQLTQDSDPEMIVTPGLVRDAFGYMASTFHRGDFPEEQLTPLMRSWKQRIADTRGAAFTERTRARLEELGWRTAKEVRLTAILGRPLERDYGDIDVLAWQPDEGRVLAIECKDVQYRKTPGEIAEQLADFRGQVRSNGKPDNLRKHLDRVERLTENLDALARYVDMPDLASVESHLVFRHPVPMEFALEHMAQRVTVSTFEELADI